MKGIRAPMRAWRFLLLVILLAGCTGKTEPTPRPVIPLPDKTGTARAIVLTPFATGSPAATPANQPVIYDVATNAGMYPDQEVPRFAKLEITFQVKTIAENLQLPFDAAPPAGVAPGQGISVDALFSPDGWKTIYTQPAFYYQFFDDQVKSEREWFYPTGQYAWKVRFTPNHVGRWQYRLVAQDSSGRVETPAQAFVVTSSGDHGFVRVSARDARYFEFSDGTYFPGLGYNMNYDHLSWNNPILGNEENFRIMSQNGIQLVRIWLSQWAIYGSSWNPWYSMNPESQSAYIPYTGLDMETTYPGSEASLRLTNEDPCRVFGIFKAPPAVRRDTTYRVRVRYRTGANSGPRVEGKPYGLVAKTGGWLWGDGNYCDDPATGTTVTPYQSTTSDGWQILEGSLRTGPEEDFLPNFYLVLENVNQGSAWIDEVWIEEDLGDGKYGPNILYKPWMAHHLYMDQRNAYAFDKVLDLAGQYGVYIRPVVLEKNEFIFNRIDFSGQPVRDDPRCADIDPLNNPKECPGNDWFYGDFQAVTKTRWLQQAWWRYLQARWGYSTHIQSWELLNEGDPHNSRHYALAEAFGSYMHQFQPDDHLVSTSFWHSFPKAEFWANSAYPHIDFADVHQYIPDGAACFADAAQCTYDVSMEYGAKRPGGAGKPVIRGETAFTVSGAGPPTPLFQGDTQAVWLHNFIWGGINPGGLIESYFYDYEHLYLRRDGRFVYDYRYQFGTYAEFIRTIPLNNGNYVDAQASPSDLRLRAWGQKDLQNGRAHLWIQNTGHTWRNVVAQAAILPISGAVEMRGFQPGGQYIAEWWDPYQTDRTRQITRSETLIASGDGALTLRVERLATDLAVKIQPARSR